MLTRQEAIALCMTWPGAWEDYPFHDANWTVIRRGDTKKGFAWIFEREGRIWINLKADPGWADVWKNTWSSVLPAYHMNKLHWISVILDGSVPDEMITAMIGMSFRLCGPGETRAHR
ncbi:MAG: MmcQ/YjbR family DNA-binding protein [Clostridia bacterium]|nr:MmcQ/YjbR family DNA-binding protein [Clostridia bacterium]